MAFVERLNEVEETVLLGVDAGQAAVGVDRFSRQLPLSEVETRALQNVKRRIKDQLHPDPRREHIGPVALLTRDATLEVLVSDRSELTAEEREDLEGWTTNLQSIIDGDYDALDAATVRSIRDALAGFAARARTYVSFMSEPGVPGVTWISPTSSLF